MSEKHFIVYKYYTDFLISVVFQDVLESNPRTKEAIHNRFGTCDSSGQGAVFLFRVLKE